MDDKLKLKLVENRRRVQEQYLKNRVPRRPDILRQKAGPDGDKFTSKPGGNKVNCLIYPLFFCYYFDCNLGNCFIFFVHSEKSSCCS